ncbi:hypothetical protein LTS14_003881 [Recurvomyces mirabilis]|uniref:uncharacterized protein n=1 Tax=Recurvomyces mirabilis TaxID=574656 RepID=UPI002DDEB968|nr:hypothetical protein LTS14_003881 [Recurvomyces mirabilis]
MASTDSSSSAPKVALVTGGASGMGYAVAAALSTSKTYNWSIHILDLNPDRGAIAAKELGPKITFHPVNQTYRQHKRLDFVFANAGILDAAEFYDRHDDENNASSDEPPPAPKTGVIDIDLTSVITTTHLALHYFRLTPHSPSIHPPSPRSLIITASCGGFYACPLQPLYGAAKHGTIGWTRNIASRFYRDDGIRVNAICPSAVKTNLLPEAAWRTFPEEFFTPLGKVVEVVEMLLIGHGRDEEGTERERLVGETVEISGGRHYFRGQQGYCDEAMGAMMGATGKDEFAK